MLYGRSEFYQKLLVAGMFPGKLLIGNISATKSATTVKNYFFGYTLPVQSIDIDC